VADDEIDLEQIQARFGVTAAYQLLDRHAYAFDQVPRAHACTHTRTNARTHTHTKSQEPWIRLNQGEAVWEAPTQPGVAVV